MIEITKVADLLGHTLDDIERIGNEEIIFYLPDSKYRLYHSYECCETCTIEDVCGDLRDLVRSPLTMAEETSRVSSESDPDSYPGSGTYTWTFYRFATVKGYVTIRWYGASNGYYSESVSFDPMPLTETEALALACGLVLTTHPLIVADRLDDLGRHTEAEALRQTHTSPENRSC